MPPEERVLVFVLIGLGLLRVIPALVLHQPLGSETTIALLGLVGGLWWGLRWHRTRAQRRDAS